MKSRACQSEYAKSLSSMGVKGSIEGSGFTMGLLAPSLSKRVITK